MNTAPATIKHTCQYCKKSFTKEATLAVHVCEKKKRYQSQGETGVQIGLNAYLKFYQLTQGSAKTKTFDDFADSPYYRAFARFGQYCVSIRAINIPRFVEWLLKNNKKIDHWTKDSVYGEFLAQYIRDESVTDALARAVEQSIDWSEQTGNPPNDYLRFGNDNAICYAILTGRVSPWVLYNSTSGTEFLSRINQEQILMIWNIIDADFWQKKFKQYPEDTDYARQILTQAGW